MKRTVILIIFMCFLFSLAKAQFAASNRSYVYIKAGESTEKKRSCIIDVFEFENGYINYVFNTWVSDLEKGYKKDPELRLKSIFSSKVIHKAIYDSENSTSVRVTYTDSQYTPKHFSFSKDRKTLIYWNDTEKETFIQIDKSEFAPKSINKDFLYE